MTINLKDKPRVAVIIINRDRPDLTDAVYEQVSSKGEGIEKRIFVIECGSARPDGCSRYMTHYFRDPNYKGRYYGFNKGLEFARREGTWDYYWFVVNDILFPSDQDTLKELVGAMEEDPRMALIGPGEPDVDDYFGCEPRPGRRWHKASTVHGLAWLMRAQAVDEVGYCNPAFYYSQGAGTELAYLLYKSGWFMAYSDVVTVEHVKGGSTYGKVTKISRHEYQRRAREFATSYLETNYGKNWVEKFSAVLPPEVEHNTFPWQQKVWSTRLKKEPGFLWLRKTGSWFKRRLIHLQMQGGQ